MDLFLPKHLAVEGLSVAVDLQVTRAGVKFAIQVRDPRDPLKRLHQAPFEIPSALAPPTDATSRAEPV